VLLDLPEILQHLVLLKQHSQYLEHLGLLEFLGLPEILQHLGLLELQQY
jgi:hypothetical protein